MKLSREFIRCEHIGCKFNYEKHCTKDHITVINDGIELFGLEDTVVKERENPIDCKDYEMSCKRKG